MSDQAPVLLDIDAAGIATLTLNRPQQFNTIDIASMQCLANTLQDLEHHPSVRAVVLRGAGSENQGKAIGLRGTANRIASILSPIAMGAIAEAVGLEASFYVVAGLVSAAFTALAFYLWHRPDIARSGED